MKIITTILASLFLVTNVQAIDKHIHPYVTLDAIKQFNTCTDHKGINLDKFTSTEANIVAEYTRREDDGSLERAFNWHFYDAYRVEPKRDIKHALSEGKSLHRIFKKRVNAFVEAKNNGCSTNFYRRSGSIIHYLQDMGIPAHVAPNYHAKPDSWWEYFFAEVKPDPFDGLTHPSNSNYFIDESQCKELYDEVNKLKQQANLSDKPAYSFFNHLLVSLAQNTRNAITTTRFPNSQDSFENEFWTLRNHNNEPYIGVEEKGFAPYGTKNNRDRFNLDAAPCNNGENGNTCKDFVEDRYKNIIDTTISALMYIAGTRKEKPVIDPSKPDLEICFYKEVTDPDEED